MAKLLPDSFREGIALPTRETETIRVPMKLLPAKHIWRVLAVSAAIIFCLRHVLARLGHDWWTDENYSHGLLIPFVIGYILWTQTPASG